MQKTYDGIQVLRGLGALLVVLFHVMVMVRDRLDPTSWVFTAGAAGVDLFFVISGFIMVVATHRAWGKSGTAWPFLKRRLIRILPLYWMVTTLKFAILVVGGKAVIDSWHTIASYLFIPAWNQDHQAFPLLAPGWTLAFEMFFYVLFAGMLFLKKSPVIPLTILFIVLAAIGIAGAPFQQAIWVLLDQRLLEFVLGMWVGKLVLSGRVLPRSLAWPLVPMNILLIVLTNALPAAITDQYMLIIWGIPSALLVYAVVSLEGSPLWRMRVPLALGNASYAIYLIHEFAVSAVRVVIQSAHLSGALATATALVLSILVASMAGLILHRYVEKPVTQRLRRYLTPDESTPSDPKPAGAPLSPSATSY